MKCSKGGVTLDAALEIDREEFDEWLEAANDLEKRIAEAMKD